MWAANGNNYSGVAIGFRPAAFLGIPARVQLVRYVDGNTLAEFRSLVRDIAAQFDSTHDPDDLNFWIPATRSVYSVIISLKHSSWAYEREVRMVHMQPIRAPQEGDADFVSITGYLPNGDEVRWRKPLERSVGNRTVKYLDFPFGRFHNGAFDPSQAIKKVVVGPNCNLSTDEVIDLMRDNGFQRFEVTKSDCEIR
jgi:hypothetical protein